MLDFVERWYKRTIRLDRMFTRRESRIIEGGEAGDLGGGRGRYQQPVIEATNPGSGRKKGAAGLALGVCAR